MLIYNSNYIIFIHQLVIENAGCEYVDLDAGGDDDRFLPAKHFDNGILFR
jgi:hypothetical protein